MKRASISNIARLLLVQILLSKESEKIQPFGKPNKSENVIYGSRHLVSACQHLN